MRNEPNLPAGSGYFFLLTLFCFALWVISEIVHFSHPNPAVVPGPDSLMFNRVVIGTLGAICFIAALLRLRKDKVPEADGSEAAPVEEGGTQGLDRNPL